MSSPKPLPFLILALSLFGFCASPMFGSPQQSEAKKSETLCRGLRYQPRGWFGSHGLIRGKLDFQTVALLLQGLILHMAKYKSDSNTDPTQSDYVTGDRSLYLHAPVHERGGTQ
jgi:hypothetical protein